jgi:hypothetical protein
VIVQVPTPDALAGVSLYLDLKRVAVRSHPPGHRIYLTRTQQYRGRRWWFSCPWCHRRAGMLYGHRGYQGAEVVGCRTCLELTYAGNARQGCPHHDPVVVTSPSLSWASRLWAAEREERRDARMLRWLASPSRRQPRQRVIHGEGYGLDRTHDGAEATDGNDRQEL